MTIRVDDEELGKEVHELAKTILRIGSEGAPIPAVAMLNTLMVLVQVEQNLSKKIVDSFVDVWKRQEAPMS